MNAFHGLSWLIHIGVSQVVNVQWHSGPSLLTWSPPSFYSNGSSNHTEFLYDILLNGVYMINTINTSVYLNISTCDVLFNVSITVYTDQYVSQENDQIYFNSGSNYCSYTDILEIHLLDYTVKITNRTVTFDQGTDTVNINLTNLVCINCLIALLCIFDRWHLQIMSATIPFMSLAVLLITRMGNKCLILL